mgnify:FL=1
MIHVGPENISADWPSAPASRVHQWSEVNCGWYLDHIGRLIVERPAALFPNHHGKAQIPLRELFPFYSKTLAALGITDEFFHDGPEHAKTLVEKLLVARPSELIAVHAHLYEKAKVFVAATPATRAQARVALSAAYKNRHSSSHCTVQKVPGLVPAFSDEDDDTKELLTLLAAAELGTRFLSIYEKRFQRQLKKEDGFLYIPKDEDANRDPDSFCSLPKLMRQYMNIHVCPYCGGNSLTPRTEYNTAQLDHIFPKKEFAKKKFSKKEASTNILDAKDPYINFFALLSISLFNLIPSCPTCNFIKGTKAIQISPYDERFSSEDCFFRYEVKDLSFEKIRLYLNAHKTDPGNPNTGLDSKTPLLLYGYGNDAYTFQLTEQSPPDSPRDNAAPVAMRFGIDEAERFLKMLYDYPASHISQLDSAFPDWKEAEYALPFSGLVPDDFLHVVFSKLYHDLYIQYKTGEN